MKTCSPSTFKGSFIEVVAVCNKVANAVAAVPRLDTNSMYSKGQKRHCHVIHVNCTSITIYKYLST